jgi:23S rRNA (cytosine1962-C5)-methyltransferase
MTAARVVLQPRRARPFYGRHPWVYPGAISSVEGDPADGDIVDLHAHEGPFVARGLYNSRSKIRVRLYSWSPEIPLDRDFFRQQLQTALHLRGPILGLNEPGKACRLVFSEADGLSGCTVDQYDRWLVLQFTSLGMAQRRDVFIELLVELVQPEGIYLRTERGIGQLEGLELQDGPLWGQVPAEPIVIEEHGLRFHVNLTEGQKTGFYLDQRDNRAAVARFAAGRRVLDAFCYTGGFALHCVRAGAREVEGIDVSEPALALAEANARLNQLENVRFTRSEVFDRLVSLIGAGERYSLVILDPPKFARSRNAVDEAMRGYRRLHAQSLRLLEPNGILATCCCSGLITRDMLQASLAEVAAEERRDVQLLEARGQAADHPVAVTCPETDYLKCLICRVH